MQISQHLADMTGTRLQETTQNLTQNLAGCQLPPNTSKMATTSRKTKSNRKVEDGFVEGAIKSIRLSDFL